MSCDTTHLMLTNLRVALKVAAHCDLCWPLVTQAWLVLLQLGDLRGWGGLGQLLLEVVSRKAGVIDAEVITARSLKAGHHAIKARDAELALSGLHGHWSTCQHLSCMRLGCLACVALCVLPSLC